MKHSRLLSRFLLLSLFVIGVAAVAAERDDPYAPIEANPGLPNVLLIGDSISVGYTIPVQDMLDGVYNVHRIPMNGGNTQRGLDTIDDWLGDIEWDVIHFNWGLHDVKRVNENNKMDVSKPKAISLPDYEKNLTKLGGIVVERR